MTLIFGKNILCACCGEQFTVADIVSTNNLGPLTTDLFDMARGFNIVHYIVDTCPHCGYSAKNHKTGMVTDEVREFIRKNITPRLRDGETPSWEKYEYLAMIEQFKGETALSLGDLYHQAAWCCYDYQELDKEIIYRKKAIENFEKAFENKEVPDNQLCVFTYLTGELYRRIGNKEKADQWFDNVLSLDEKLEDWEYYANLAKQQKTEPKEFINEGL